MSDVPRGSRDILRNRHPQYFRNRDRNRDRNRNGTDPRRTTKLRGKRETPVLSHGRPVQVRAGRIFHPDDTRGIPSNFPPVRLRVSDGHDGQLCTYGKRQTIRRSRDFVSLSNRLLHHRGLDPVPPLFDSNNICLRKKNRTLVVFFCSSLLSRRGPVEPAALISKKSLYRRMLAPWKSPYCAFLRKNIGRNSRFSCMATARSSLFPPALPEYFILGGLPVTSLL